MTVLSIVTRGGSCTPLILTKLDDHITELPVLRTKLYRAPVAPDLVPRDRLVARLESGSGLPGRQDPCR